MGLRDAKLSERLQLDPDLTLEKAITVVRQKEPVKKQELTLRAPTNAAEVAPVTQTRSKPQKKPHPPVRQPERRNQVKGACHRCGKSPHNRQNCPAKEAKCYKCQKIAHFGTVCRSKEISTVTMKGIQETDDLLFLDTLTSEGRSKP